MTFFKVFRYSFSCTSVFKIRINMYLYRCTSSHYTTLDNRKQCPNLMNLSRAALNASKTDLNLKTVDTILSGNVSRGLNSLNSASDWTCLKDVFKVNLKIFCFSLILQFDIMQFILHFWIRWVQGVSKIYNLSIFGITRFRNKYLESWIFFYRLLSWRPRAFQKYMECYGLVSQ